MSDPAPVLQTLTDNGGGIYRANNVLMANGQTLNMTFNLSNVSVKVASKTKGAFGSFVFPGRRL